MILHNRSARSLYMAMMNLGSECPAWVRFGSNLLLGMGIIAVSIMLIETIGDIVITRL